MLSVNLLTVSSLILVLTSYSNGVTTTHYDKPSDIKLIPSEERISRTPRRLQKPSNITLTERQKRLLPYINYYLSEQLGHPYRQQLYRDDERYQILTPSKASSYQPSQTKFSELMATTYQPSKDYEPQQILTDTKGKFTPFLDSNAIPGPFRPMIRTEPQKVRVHYTTIQQNEKIPNYSTIYDKLSQLKFQQNALEAQLHYQNPRNNVPQIVLKKRPTINLIPIQEYQEQGTYNPIQVPETFIHTYTPTNIDVAGAIGPAYETENYDKQTSVKDQSEVDENQHQDEISITQQPITVMQLNTPKQHIQEQIVIDEQPIKITPQQNYIPTIALNPQAQYIVHEQKPYHNQKHMQYLQEVVPNSKPFILIPQKVVPVKQYAETPKPEEIKVSKPIIILQPVTQIKSYTPEPIAPSNYQSVTVQQVPTEITTPTAQETQTVATESPNSLSQILKRLQDTNALPHTLTPDNIDNSIKTLVHILNSLKKQQKLTRPIVVADHDDGSYDEEQDNEAGVGLGSPHGGTPGTITETFPARTSEGGTPGRPGVDYPALSSIPQTSFNCKTQRYKGFFADPDTHCQVWHYCDLNGGQASFLCPNGTIFSQVALTCDWWFNVKCSTTTQLYVLNERLYKYIIPLTPKFPEDYTGPLVDRYLALKFKEMEEKMKNEKKKKKPKEEDKDKEIDELQLLEDKNSENASTTETQEEQ